MIFNLFNHCYKANIVVFKFIETNIKERIFCSPVSKLSRLELKKTQKEIMA